MYIVCGLLEHIKTKNLAILYFTLIQNLASFLAQFFKIYFFIEISFASKNTLGLLSPCTLVPSTYSLG
jgi:hypothetical protein